MGYRRMTEALLYSIQIRVAAGESNRQIARELGLDKKTVNQYAAKISELHPTAESGDFMDHLDAVAPIVKENRKPTPALAVLEPYADEIRSLIVGDRAACREGMKAKTAWMVIRARHNLSGKTSYESYKRFVRERGLTGKVLEPVARIETDPGLETQIDYGKVGTTLVGDSRKTINAFCGRLSFSRLPYIQYVTSQNACSFASSVASMFTFYGGVTERINLDNLKAGVLKVDLYDPEINRTFAELCEYYGVLPDPARAVSPRDKGKIERLVPVARELWKRLTALMPEASLDEINQAALTWCREEYGRTKHGTTGLKPLEEFETIERQLLTPLPAEPFIPATWTVARVAPDQFIVVKGKYYGLPASFIGKRVDVRSTENLVSIFFEFKKVREYAVSSKRRVFLPADFPDYAQPFVPSSYASFLIHQGEAVSAQTGKYIRLILESSGNLGIRRAQGCLALLAKNHDLPGLSHVVGQAIAQKIVVPDRLRSLLNAERVQNVIVFPASPTGTAMTRDASYYVDTSPQS